MSSSILCSARERSDYAHPSASPSYRNRFSNSRVLRGTSFCRLVERSLAEHSVGFIGLPRAHNYDTAYYKVR